MDKITYVSEVQNFIEQFVDNRKEITDTVHQYNCVYCGRSKNNKPHMRIDYANGFYYCYRCPGGGILHRLLKLFKNNNNKEYVNNLLKLYFSFYEYDPKEASEKITDTYRSYNFTIDNLTLEKVEDTIANPLIMSFLQRRFPTLNDQQLRMLVTRFKLVIPPTGNRLYYNSFFRKFAYSYSVFADLSHKKEKFTNTNITNDRKDYYYLITRYEAQNLYISEGVFDLMTWDAVDPLKNTYMSNFLALCSRSYKHLYDILLNSGKFFYHNIYVIIDNDVNEKRFTTGITRALANNGNSHKLKLYKNLYTILPQKHFVDINDQYKQDNELKHILIKKIR